MQIKFDYNLYKDTFEKYYELLKKHPEDYSPYKKVVLTLLNNLKNGYLVTLQDIISHSARDFFQNKLMSSLNNEDLATIDILSDYFLEYGAIIDSENYYIFMEECLNILEKKGTNMSANHVLPYLYERLIDAIPPPINTNKMFLLLKKLIKLPYNESWLDVPACYSIHYKTLDLLDNNIEIFDTLIEFTENIQDWELKNYFASHILYNFIDRSIPEYSNHWRKKIFDMLNNFVQSIQDEKNREYVIGRIFSYFEEKGLVDENLNWIGEK